MFCKLFFYHLAGIMVSREPILWVIFCSHLIMNVSSSKYFSSQSTPTYEINEWHGHNGNDNGNGINLVDLLNKWFPSRGGKAILKHNFQDELKNAILEEVGFDVFLFFIFEAL